MYLLFTHDCSNPPPPTGSGSLRPGKARPVQPSGGRRRGQQGCSPGNALSLAAQGDEPRRGRGPGRPPGVTRDTTRNTSHVPHGTVCPEPRARGTPGRRDAGATAGTRGLQEQTHPKGPGRRGEGRWAGHQRGARDHGLRGRAHPTWRRGGRGRELRSCGGPSGAAAWGEREEEPQEGPVSLPWQGGREALVSPHSLPTEAPLHSAVGAAGWQVAGRWASVVGVGRGPLRAWVLAPRTC